MKDDRAQVPLGGAEDIVFGDQPSPPRSGAAGATSEATCGSRSGWACAALRQTNPIPPAMCLGLPKGHLERTPYGVTTSAGRSASNKPNSLPQDRGHAPPHRVAGNRRRQTRRLRQTKPIPPAGPGRETGNTNLDARDKSEIQIIQTGKPIREPTPPNKANRPNRNGRKALSYRHL